jgi:hypothetical protein
VSNPIQSQSIVTNTRDNIVTIKQSFSGCPLLSNPFTGILPSYEVKYKVMNKSENKIFILQHVDLLLGNAARLTNIQQPLLSNGFENKHVPHQQLNYKND